MVVALLPTAALAADNRIYVKAIDLTLELPQAGMTKRQCEEELKLLSAQTAYGDLAAIGAVKLQKLRWQGEFDKTDPSNPKFQAGMSYIATIQIQFVWGEGYVANHEIINNNYHMDSNLFKVTVNGAAAETRESSPGFPEVVVNLTVPAPELSAGEKTAAEAVRQEKFALRHAALRSSATPYTTAQADALWVEKQAYAPIVLNMTAWPERSHNQYGYMASEVIDKSLNKDYITKVIVDFDYNLFENKDQAESFTKSLVFQYDNLREIWLSDKVDAVEFLKNLKSATEGNGTSLEKWYWTNSTSFCTAAATLYIPSSSAAAVKASNEWVYGYISPCFSIKVYDGDVYTAQNAGDAAARDYCTNHVFNDVIMAADRIANLTDCVSGPLWYYSCGICGKCEYNNNHTINRNYMSGNAVPKAEHDYWLRLATDEAYIGINAAGDHVYWYSCTYCGKPYNYHQKHLTQKDMENSGITELTFQEWNARRLSALAQREMDALNRTGSQPDMFVISARSAANMSTWAQSDVNHALDNGLLDTALLGNDYTMPISRLQLCSVAVRLAETLTGKEIAPAPSGTFTDTDNLYVRKAYAADITTGVTATAFDPDSTLIRQQMATFFYRTLQYVEKNSNYRYTDYVSRLSTYSDSSQIQPWATEAMDFMNALDFVEGTTATTLDPNGICTIEQAAAVACRSIYAHQIGWYQATESVRYQSGAGGITTYITLNKGERIWVTGGRMGVGVNDSNLDYANGEYEKSGYLPVVEPRTGEICYITGSKLKPIRD